MSDESITEIIAGCRRGDRSTQRRLYELFHRRIYRLLVRIVGTDTAADLTQRVFLQVLVKIDQFAASGRFERWLYRIAVNEAYQHLRREKRRRQRQLSFDLPDDSVPGHQRAERKELVDKALARLDPELRSIFLLREIEELSYREIAQVLEIPGGTVGSRLNRARRELRKHLIDLGWEP